MSLPIRLNSSLKPLHLVWKLIGGTWPQYAQSCRLIITLNYRQLLSNVPMLVHMMYHGARKQFLSEQEIPNPFMKFSHLSEHREFDGLQKKSAG